VVATGTIPLTALDHQVQSVLTRSRANVSASRHFPIQL
jgi:hypothetical protein